jgi:hypothetical protein
MISGTCPECRQDLEHCHGTAIEHCDGSADCSDDPNCQLPGELHLFLISCAEVGCDCGPAAGSAAEVGAAEFGAAEFGAAEFGAAGAELAEVLRAS